MEDKGQGTSSRKNNPPAPPQRPDSTSRRPPPPVQPRRPYGQSPGDTTPIRSPQVEEEIPTTAEQAKRRNQQVRLSPPSLNVEQTLQSGQPSSVDQSKKKKFAGIRRLFSRKKSPAHEERRPSHRHSQNAPLKIKTSRILYTTDEEVRDALMEFGMFIIFLILTSLVTLSIRHSYMFYFNDTMKKLFTTRELVVAPSVTVSFEKLITVPDWWDYLIYNFLVTLHGDMSEANSDDSDKEEGIKDEVDAGDPAADNPNDGEIPADDIPPDGRRIRRKKQAEDKAKDKEKDKDKDKDKNKDKDEDKVMEPDKKRQNPHFRKNHLHGRVFLHENLLLGPPRLRQIRVRKDSCYVNDAFIRYFNTCYAEYSAGAQEITKEHGGAPFRTMSELDSTPLWTTLNFYRTGGYTIDLTYDKEENLEIIKRLKKEHWLDRGSRLCLVEFNLYNENTDIFQSAKFIAEIPPTGGVIPQSHLQTVKQFSFLTDKSLAMSVVYIFWYIMIVYYNINEISEIRKSGFKNYFKSILNVLDAIILLFCYLALVYNIWHTIKVKSLVNKARIDESYQSLDTLCFWNTIYVDMMAILAFLVWIKIFKFISFNKTLVQFTTTLKRCSKDLAGFSVMFGIVFLAYAQLGLLLFGTKHPDFRNFVTSILTMIRMILGDFQYNLIEEANRVLGPIYFLTYILLVFFILLNMFLAIIMETYNSVKSEITQGRSQLGSYICKKLKTAVYFILHCGRKRQHQDTLPPQNTDQAFDDLDTGRLNQPKVQLRRNMTPAEQHYFEDIPQDVKNKDMYRLNNRVSLLEEILEQLVTNMDGILKRVEREVKKTNK